MEKWLMSNIKLYNEIIFKIKVYKWHDMINAFDSYSSIVNIIENENKTVITKDLV